MRHELRPFPCTEIRLYEYERGPHTTGIEIPHDNVCQANFPKRAHTMGADCMFRRRSVCDYSTEAVTRERFMLDASRFAAPLIEDKP